MRGLQTFTEVCKCNNACIVKHGRVAQSVEQRIENPRVTGSIPVSATNKIKDLQHNRLSPFLFLDYAGDYRCIYVSPRNVEATVGGFALNRLND